MKPIYKLIENEFGGSFIERTDNLGLISFIPIDEDNADYQAYLNNDKPKVEHLTEKVADEAKAK